jgi:hypothetical protein
MRFVNYFASSAPLTTHPARKYFFAGTRSNQDTDSDHMDELHAFMELQNCKSTQMGKYEIFKKCYTCFVGFRSTLPGRQGE